MIRIGDEYLEYDGMPDVVRQIKNADTIDSAGDFSYSFSIPPTSTNIRILKIGINRTDTLVSTRIPCTIEDLGTVIYSGYLRIEGVIGNIELSFFSGNSEWFAELEGKLIYQLDLSQFKLPLINIDPSPIIPTTWTNTEGIVYTFGLDRGDYENYSGYRVLGTVFRAMVYVKNVMNAIFQQNGYKLTGELLSESRYVNAIAGTGSDSAVSFPEIQRAREAFIGKGTQAINTTPQLVTFTDTSYPYFVGEKCGFAGSRYTATEDVDVSFAINLTLDASVNYTLELRINGSPSMTLSGTGSVISDKFGGSSPATTFAVGDYAEVFMYLDAGTVNILSGDFTIKFIWFNAEYPQFFFSDMTQTDFVRSIFTMLNVTASFDPFTKTVTANLFKNVDSVQQDLSEYIEGADLNFTDPLDDFSKDNIFQYEAGSDDDIETYNDSALVPYGGGNISIGSGFLSGKSERDVSFASSFSYYNEKFKANMMGLGLLELSRGEPFAITGVSDDGFGTALFQTLDPHGLSQNDYVEIGDTSTGQYLGIGIVSSAPTDSQFTVRYLSFQTFGSVGLTGSGYPLSATESGEGKVFIALNIPNMLVRDFSHNTTINYGGTLYDRVAYAYFVKSDIGLPIDDYREVLAFDNPDSNGYTGITLLDSYYGHTRNYLNNPVKIKGRFRLPYRVFKNLDLTKSIRVKTPEFNSLCFTQKITGYNPCEIELIQL